MSFKAVLLNKDQQGFSARVTELEDEDLPAGSEVLISVEYSTLNYKDALALTDHSPVVRQWPMVPGIDGAGLVLESDDPRFLSGQRVVLNGWGAGERHWGCLAQRARVPADWLIRLPDSLSTWAAMAIGTAGYTAALSVDAVQKHGVQPEDGEVLVTGATGGVGSIAIALLAAQGYRVVAATGKPQERYYLEQLGATDIIEREELAAPGKPLQKERWTAVIDAGGSHTLANACAQTRYRGIVTACGLVQGMEFPASVAPFILRGVTLAGIDSVMAPHEFRDAAWKRLDRDLNRETLSSLAATIPLDQVVGAAQKIIDGKLRGRLVVDVNG